MEYTVLAYLDPGTGSLIFQIIMALGVGILFKLKIVRQKIKLAFSKFFAKEKV